MLRRIVPLLLLVAAPALARQDSRDERLATEVREALAKSGFSDDAVNVRVSRGVIYLKGTVSDARGKLKAVRAAFTVSSVEELEVEIGVLKGITPQLEEEVWQALFREGLEDVDVEVLVENGIAALRGEVRSSEIESRVLQVAGGVPGIRAVRDEVWVSGTPQARGSSAARTPEPPPFDPPAPDPVAPEPVKAPEPAKAAEPVKAAEPAPAVAEPNIGPSPDPHPEPARVENWTSRDPTLSHQIAYAILTYPGYTVFDHVQFSLEGGDVVLLGAVTDVSKKRELEERIRAIGGVGGVENEIRVLSSAKEDVRLRQKLFERIYEDPLFAPFARDQNPPIHILVEGGIVTLTGVVDETIQRMSAEGIARNVFEVTLVRNRIRVRER